MRRFTESGVRLPREFRDARQWHPIATVHWNEFVYLDPGHRVSSPGLHMKTRTDEAVRRCILPSPGYNSKVSRDSALGEKGDWFCGERLPEFTLQRGNCCLQILGRYLKCETHSLLPSFSSEDTLLCQALASAWNQSFRDLRPTLINESLIGSKTIKRYGDSDWPGLNYLGPQSGETVGVKQKDPGLHMMSTSAWRALVGSDSSFANDSDLTQMNNVVYSNILLRLSEALGVDDYVAERLYFRSPLLFGGAEAIADFRQLGVSPGLLLYLRDVGLERAIPAARLLERYRGDLTWHLDEDRDYEGRAIFNHKQKGVLLMELIDSPSGGLADIFEVRVAVRQRSFPKSELLSGVEADGICFARVYRSGEIVCERENHKQHGFGQYPPAEVATMAATVLRQRFAVGTGGDPQLDWRLANRSDLWMYIDELPEYIGIAKDSSVEGYLMHRVPPELVEMWTKRGIEDATEMLWADVIYDEMKTMPTGYIGAVVQVLGRMPIDVCRLAKGDHETTKKLIWAVENKGTYILDTLTTSM
jgi:hypothetical protein